jgi:hypothetical protein
MPHFVRFLFSARCEQVRFVFENKNASAFAEVFAA